jgi:hypothetical protein
MVEHQKWMILSGSITTDASTASLTPSSLQAARCHLRRMDPQSVASTLAAANPSLRASASLMAPLASQQRGGPSSSMLAGFATGTATALATRLSASQYSLAAADGDAGGKDDNNYLIWYGQLGSSLGAIRLTTDQQVKRGCCCCCAFSLSLCR